MHNLSFSTDLVCALLMRVKMQIWNMEKCLIRRHLQWNVFASIWLRHSGKNNAATTNYCSSKELMMTLWKKIDDLIYSIFCRLIWSVSLVTFFEMTFELVVSKKIFTELKGLDHFHSRLGGLTVDSAPSFFRVANKRPGFCLAYLQ